MKTRQYSQLKSDYFDTQVVSKNKFLIALVKTPVLVHAEHNIIKLNSMSSY